jgi:DNA transposition AAA+ family ATPase
VGHIPRRRRREVSLHLASGFYGNKPFRGCRVIRHSTEWVVDSLLQLKKGTTPKEINENAATPSVSAARIKGTATSSQAFVETIEYSRFVEFCDACRHFRYIGLCYGPPGIGKTLSAVRYSRAEKVIAHDRWTSETTDDLPVDTLLYTTSVVNTPSRISQDINMAREKVMSIVLDPLRREGSAALEVIRIRDERRRKELLDTPGFSPRDWPSGDPTYLETYKEYRAKERAVADPTTLILVDEADRLQMNSLEQMRSIFDEGTAGMVLIGMPGIEKRVARFPQFYSRIGFVHEFRPLDASQVQELLEKRWTPAGVVLPNEQLVPEVIASLIRMSGGNFRLLTRLLTQIERVLSVNDLHVISTAVVEAARDSLVIGPG